MSTFQIETWQVYLGLTIIGIFQGIGYAIADIYFKPIIKKYHLKRTMKIKDKIKRVDTL